MSGWTDPVAWDRQKNGADCSVCRSRASALAEPLASWVLVGPDDPVRGYACLVFSRHAIELHELTSAEGNAFMADIKRVSAAIAGIVKPVKMNYEIHGNTAPHLHAHFFPRYEGDQFEAGPINPKVAMRPAYAPGEFATFRERLRIALQTSAA